MLKLENRGLCLSNSLINETHHDTPAFMQKTKAQMSYTIAAQLISALFFITYKYSEYNSFTSLIRDLLSCEFLQPGLSPTGS